MPEKEQRTWTIANANSGEEIVAFTSVIDFSASHPSDAVEEIVERGSFVSYNKTIQPTTVDATLGFDGTVDERQAALDTLESLRRGLTTFSFVTPEHEYKNMNLCGFEQPQRTNSYAANILIITIHLKEIRTANSQYYTGSLPEYQAANPEDMTAAKSGTVQVNSVGGTSTSNNSASYDLLPSDGGGQTISPAATTQSATQLESNDWTEEQLDDLAEGWKNSPDYNPETDQWLKLDEGQYLNVETGQVLRADTPATAN